MSLDTFLRLGEDKKNMIIKNSLLEFSSKGYQDANTDNIIKACGISKGSLFHYFGSKKNLYLHLISHSLNIFDAAAKGNTCEGNSFYDILFIGLESKLALYQSHPLEIALLTMAAKEQSSEVYEDKNKLLRQSFEKTQMASLSTLRYAFSQLQLKVNCDPSLTFKGLLLYIEALRSKYLEEYRHKPMDFYQDKEAIKLEIQRYVDLLFNGILREE